MEIKPGLPCLTPVAHLLSSQVVPAQVTWLQMKVGQVGRVTRVRWLVWRKREPIGWEEPAGTLAEREEGDYDYSRGTLERHEGSFQIENCFFLQNFPNNFKTIFCAVRLLCLDFQMIMLELYISPMFSSITFRSWCAIK